MHSIMLSAFSALVLGVAAAPSPNAIVTDSVIPGYKIVPLEWKIDVGGGKDPLHLTSTVEQVLAQLKESDPEYEAKVEVAVAAAPAPSEVETSENPAAVLIKRWTYDGHFCFGRWQRTNRSRPAPISWRNDANFVRTLGSFAEIGDAANEIINLCIQDEFGYQWSSGQYFYREQWNVIVRWDDC